MPSKKVALIDYDEKKIAKIIAKTAYYYFFFKKRGERENDYLS